MNFKGLNNCYILNDEKTESKFRNVDVQSLILSNKTISKNTTIEYEFMIQFVRFD